MKNKKTKKLNHEPSDDDFLDMDIAFESAQFQKVISELGLAELLDQRELEILHELYHHADGVNLFLNIPGGISGKGLERIHESLTQHAEGFLIKARQDLLDSPGWKKLSPEIKMEAERRLFTVEVSDANLAKES